MKPRDYEGARWWKVDFHTHTPASNDTYWAKENTLTPRDWLLQWMRAGIDCVAVTDHNTGAWIDILKNELQVMLNERPGGFRELVLFPGVEISASSGIHLLAILDPSKSSSDIDTLLGSVGYRATKGDTDGVTEASPITVVKAIAAMGGLAVPAHADTDKGLLECSRDSGKPLRDSHTMRQVLASPEVIACEVVDTSRPKPALYTEAKCNWTEVVGSDCHSFKGKNLPGSRFTWVKMSRPSLDGLRLALLDGARFSVRRSDDATKSGDPNARPEHFLEELSIGKARFMGHGTPETLRFSPWFNAIIGGRGTGKSTTVHALRLAFRRDTELPETGEHSEAARVFNQFCRRSKGREDVGGLTDQTEILATVSRDGQRHRLRWRSDSQGHHVEDYDGSDWQASSTPIISAERFPIRIFSQGQIAELARSGHSALLGLIDEAAGTGDVKRILYEAVQHFLRLRTGKRELEKKLARRDMVVVKLEDIKRKMAAIEATSGATSLKRYDLASRQERDLNSELQGVEHVARSLSDMASRVNRNEPLPESFSSEVEDDSTRLARHILEQLREATRTAALDVAAAANKLHDSVKTARDAIERSVWRTESDRVKQEYEACLSQLNAQGIQTPNEYESLVTTRQLLEKELSEFDALLQAQSTLATDLKKQTQIILGARRSLSDIRKEFLTRSLTGNAYVQISLIPYGQDAKFIERSLRDALNVGGERFANDLLVVEDGTSKSGMVPELISSLPTDYQQRVEAMESRLDALRSRFEGAAQGQEHFGAPFRKHLQREAEKYPEFLDRLLAYFPEDDLDVRYSLRGDGRQFRPIEQASAGQQAAAMLAFLLAHGREPIVLDQPEDDLDNQLIYDLVVSQIRENKLHRQVIAVTHNPNIVVNGDSEMLHVFDFTKGQCGVVRSGCLQEKDVREQVCRVMEGGEEAFKQRYQRLGDRR